MVKSKNFKSWEKGLVHYYYGNGNGKTSILLGHIMRAIGRYLPIILFQFLKKHDSQGEKWYYMGEYVTLTEKLNIPVIQYGEYDFIKYESQKQIAVNKYQNALKDIEEALNSGKYSIVFLDEVITAIALEIINIDKFIEILNNRKVEVEVFLSGREEIQKLMDISDYCIKLEEIKHPFKKGVHARPGIEY